MPNLLQDPKNLGAMTANTASVFSFTDSTTFPVAPFASVERVEVANGSLANLDVRANGLQYHIPKGAPGTIVAGGRIWQLVITPDATVNDKEVQIIAKGYALNKAYVG